LRLSPPFTVHGEDFLGLRVWRGPSRDLIDVTEDGEVRSGGASDEYSSRERTQ
jgi:hypothetical protein